MKSQDRAAIQALPEAELQVQLRECDEKIFKLNFANASSPLKNALEIRNLKRHRARLKTWLRQKSLVSQNT